MNLLAFLQAKIHVAVAPLVADPGPYAAMVKPAQDARFGDYQANCAMSLAKALGKKPRDIAEEIKRSLVLDDALEEPSIAGPGFINLRFRADWLARQTAIALADPKLGVEPATPPGSYVIDFSSPNVAKPMHVGHLRSTILGDSLTRLLRFLGHQVVTDNHLGDWGTQFGMLIHGYKNHLDRAALAADPVREMVRIYVLVRQLTKPADDEDDEGDAGSSRFTPEQVAQAKVILDACRQETAKLHAGDEENNRLWREMMPWGLEELDRVYRKLEVPPFDQTLGESFYNPQLAGVVEDLLAKGIAQHSKGAVAIFFGENVSPALVRKGDGAFTYTTSDLATIRHRVQTWNPTAILYVVDARQSLHFKNLFEAARRWGYDKVDLEHIAFGSILGDDKKPLKTREGGVVELGALLDEAVARASQVYASTRAERLERGEEVPELSEQERQEIERAVGIGAVKYADLLQNRTTDYVFNWDKMLAMEGNTAAYMQYAYVRIRGIFRKAGVQPGGTATLLLPEPAERALALQLLRFPEALQAAASEYKPSLVSAYLWDLAKSYSGFYQQCSVLKAETDELRQSRLGLCDLTARVIQQSLGLLGIRTVEKM